MKTIRVVAIPLAVATLCISAASYYAAGQDQTKKAPANFVVLGGRKFRAAGAQEEEGECKMDELTEEKKRLIGPEFNLGPGTLKKSEVPMPPNLGEFVKDKNMAVVLGKALFWDMQVGSDGVQACASCHFRAGVDPRSVNQLSPGGPGTSEPEKEVFDMHFTATSRNRVAAFLKSPLAKPSRVTFELRPPNSRLQESDFPFHKLKDPNDRKSEVLRSVDDIASSQGVIQTAFVGAIEGERSDRGTVFPDEIFNVDGKNVRRVEPRNTPTVINAIFFHRNFWDGRAQEIFNGRNILGVRDQNATVIKAHSRTHLQPVKVRLENASLASLSVGPPLSAEEMSFVAHNGHRGREFPDIGKRITSAQPLVGQIVNPGDSVLGFHSVSRATGDPSRPGLSGRYEEYIKAAFHDTWWDSSLFVEVDAEGKEHFVPSPTPGSRNYTLMQYNFSLFFGLALQSYMATLVSDDSKLDRHFDAVNHGLPGLLTDVEKAGMEVFGTARCADCHNGPEFSGAVFRTLKKGFLAPGHPDVKPPYGYWQFPEEVERMPIGSCDIALYDQGFYNIGVRPFTEDLGIGAPDNSPDKNPLSAAKVLVSRAKLKNIELRNLFVPRLSEFLVASLATNPDAVEILPVPDVVEGERTSVEGAFKIPSLRNIALTAPYFHNGGQLTLRQVIEFYNRGGDFHDWVSPQGVAQDRFMDLGIGRLHLEKDPSNFDKLEAFLNTLTDERVVKRSAPFDHPQLFVPNGHTRELTEDGKAYKDVIVEIPAVGANGGAPLPGFLKF